jgi:AcrR family transcriptional regulator
MESRVNGGYERRAHRETFEQSGGQGHANTPLRYSSTGENSVTEPNSPFARQYHKGNVAEDLMEVASRILETETVEDLSVRRLAREVGVTPANFYNHYPGLNDLLLEIGAKALRERARHLAHIRRTSKTKAEAIRRVVRSYIDLALSKYQLFRIVFGLIPDCMQHRRFSEASDESMGELVELVYGQRIHDPADLDASRERCKAAYGVFALGYGLARITVDGSVPFSTERRADMLRFVDSVVDGFIAGEFTSLIS